MPKRRHQQPPVVLAIAGYDPSSGAGITADVKTIAANGCYGVTCITALTVQSTRGVKHVEAIEGRIITETLEELAVDLQIAAVKVGMLGSAEAAWAVAAFLKRHRLENVVVDPVLKSSSGADLLSQQALEILRSKILRQATVITPNIVEAAVLSGMSVEASEQMEAAALKLLKLGARSVVITGGHLATPVDLVLVPRREPVLLQGEKIATHSTHGTGCAFSSAMACALAGGKSVIDAARTAKRFVESALRKAPSLGTGSGPVI